MDTPTAYVIERDVPLPAGGRGYRKMSPLTLALLQMQPGDSIFIANKRSVQICRHFKTAQNKGLKFTSRKVEGGLRVWRLPDAEA